MIVYYSEYSMFVVGDDVSKWLLKWACQLKTIMSDLRLRNGNFPFQNRKGCELGLYRSIQILLSPAKSSHRHKESYKDLNLKKASLKGFLEKHNCTIHYLLRYIS